MKLDKLLLKRGTTEKCLSYQGSEGELVYDRTAQQARLYTADTLTSGGKVLLDTAGGDIDGDLTVEGNVTATNVMTTSDLRKKDVISKIEQTFDLNDIDVCQYTFKKDNVVHTGLIAQQVEQVFPNAVYEDQQGFKAIDYNAVVAYLLNEIKVLKNTVDQLK